MLAIYAGVSKAILCENECSAKTMKTSKGKRLEFMECVGEQGVSSIEPDDRGGEMDGVEEVAGGLVVAGGNVAILLELVKELLNQVARPIQMLVALALFVAALGRRVTTPLPAFCNGSITRSSAS